jgi:phosphohistidine phosphatase
MRLYLLRHGPAADRNAFPGPDPDRPLTSEGRKQVRTVARALRSLDLEIDRILSSPYTRARDTAAIVAHTLDLDQHPEFSDALCADVAALTLLAALTRLRPRPDNLLLVGHEPQLSQFASLLLSGQPDLNLTLKKAGLACLAVSRFKPHPCAALEWWLTPGQLARLH